MYQCITVAKIKEGALDEVVKAVKILAEATRKEPGNIYYYLLKASNSTNTIIFSEAWEAEANFLAHVKGAPCKKFGETIQPVSEGAPVTYPGEVLV